MKKLFLAICFNFIFSAFAFAKVTQISGLEKLPPVQQPSQEIRVREINENDFNELLERGFSKAKIVDEKSINKNADYLRNTPEETKEKSIFKKIYDQAMGRVTDENQIRKDVLMPNILRQISVEEQQKMWGKNNIPTILAALPPDNKMTKIPAMEHIPYLMSFIEVLPTGLVKFEETAVVVANGEKLKKGLTKILPMYIYNSEGKKQKLDYSIIKVTVNDDPVDYHISSNGYNVLLVPSADYELDPGIYTYRFSYVVDNLLWRTKEFYQFYWDVGGNGWNLVVDRLGAVLNFPQPDSIKEQTVLLGSVGDVSSNAVSIQPNGQTAYSYIAGRPLFVGEGMHVIAAVKKDVLLPKSIWQKILRIFYLYNDIVLASVGLLSILVSFMISLVYIKKDKGQIKLALSKTAVFLRYLMFNRFDGKSVCGFLLELYRKNIIDIQESGDAILLIKRTDNLQSLTTMEKKAFKKLFAAHETVFNITPQNKLPLKRLATALKKGLQYQIMKFKVKLSVGYWVMGVSILMLTEFFISLFSYTPLYDFLVMVGATLICMAGSGLWLFKVGLLQKIVIRSLSFGILLFGLVVFSAVISPLAALLLIASVYTINYFLNSYSERSGLIRHYVNETSHYRDYLQKNHDTIVLGREFISHQAAILVLDLEKDFDLPEKTEYNKLKTIEKIMKIFQGESR